MKGRITIIVLLVVLGFATGYLYMQNKQLSQQVNDLSYQVELQTDKINDLIIFQNNLYAERYASGKDGTHRLSISDIYYKQNFTQDDSEN